MNYADYYIAYEAQRIQRFAFFSISLAMVSLVLAVASMVLSRADVEPMKAEQWVDIDAPVDE